MSVGALPDVAPPQKIVGAFQSAPTLVRVLAAGVCLPLLLGLGQAGTAITGQSGPSNPDHLFTLTPGVVSDAVEWMVAGTAGVGLVLGLVLALISFQLRKRTPLGPLTSWLLTLAPVVIAIVLVGPPLLGTMEGYAFFGAEIVAPWLTFGLVLAWMSCLLGRGLARGGQASWLMTLVLVALAFLMGLLSVLAYTTMYSIVNVLITVAVMALLFTPVVRRHCTRM